MISLPTWLVIVIIVALLIAIVGVWAAGLASRLNRLHIRTDAARISLEGALSARAAVISAMQPDIAEYAQTVTNVPLRAMDMGGRSDVENKLLNQLTKATTSTAAFVEASTKVDLAARFYNDAVADTRSVRAKLSVRLFHLAGHAPLPEYYEALAQGSFSGNS